MRLRFPIKIPLTTKSSSSDNPNMCIGKQCHEGLVLRALMIISGERILRYID